MATINLSVKYRPVRIGFLVRDGDIEDCVKAAGMNTLLWGGFCNPIIPVSADGKLTKRLLDLFSVDIMIPVSSCPEVDKIIADNEFLRSPHHFGEPLFQEDWQSKKKMLSYLDAINIVDAYWERDLRHTEETFKSNCTLVRWDAADPLAGLFALQFGFYPDLDLLHNFERAFVGGMKARELIIPKDGPVEAKLAGEISPIGLTRLDLAGHGGGWRLNDGLYVGNEKEFEDLVSFWNLRAAGERIKFLSLRHADRVRPFIVAHLDELDKRRAPNPNIEDQIAVHFRQSIQSQVQDILKTFETKKAKVLSYADDFNWNGFNVKPTIYHFGWKRILASQDDYFSKPVVNFGLPEKDFLDQRPGRQEAIVKSQQLAVSLDFFSDLGCPGHTLRPPFIRELNEFYSRAIAVDPWALRVEREGVAVIKDLGDDSLSLYPLPHQSLIEKIFDLAGIRANKSQAGLLATQIIKSMREFSPLEACRVFKVRGVRSLLNDLRPGNCISWNDAVSAIGRDDFNRFKDLYIAPRPKRELEPTDVLNFLLEKRILVPRLRWIERLLRRRKSFKCVECGLQSEILMGVFEGNWRCPYCEHEQYLPQYIGEWFSQKDMWRFAKRGLFAKDNNQEGAIPVILTLLVLLRILERGSFVHSTSLNLKFDKDCETDLCVLQYHHGDEIEIGIGECKSRGKITEQDISNLKAVRKKLNAIGLNCHLVFAKTQDSFSQEEIGLFKELKTERVPFILFTNREIEPYHPYWAEDEKKKLPFPHAFTLSELALNSDFRYIPMDEAERRRFSHAAPSIEKAVPVQRG